MDGRLATMVAASEEINRATNLFLFWLYAGEQLVPSHFDIWYPFHLERQSRDQTALSINLAAYFFYRTFFSKRLVFRTTGP